MGSSELLSHDRTLFEFEPLLVLAALPIVLLLRAVDVAAEQNNTHTAISPGAIIKNPVYGLVTFEVKDMPYVLGEDLGWYIFDMFAAVFLDRLSYVSHKFIQEKQA